MEPTIDYEIHYVDNEVKLKPVPELCYEVLGQHLRDIENYTFEE